MQYPRYSLLALSGLLLAGVFGCSTSDRVPASTGGDPNVPAVDGGDEKPDGGDGNPTVHCTWPEPVACGGGLPDCGDGFICVHDACVPDCGTGAADLDSAFVGTLRVLGGACTPAGLHGAAETCADTTVDASLYTVRLVGRNVELSRAQNAFTDGKSQVLITLATSDGGGSVFLSQYVEPSPDGTFVAFGYTLSDFSGEVLVLNTKSQAVTRVVADGNYDVAWLNNRTLLINGLSAGQHDSEQALYAVTLHGDGSSTSRKVINDFGDASGSVSVIRGGELVVAGAYGDGLGTDDNDNLVFAWSGSAISTLIDNGVIRGAVGTETVPRVVAPSDFEIVGSALVSFDFVTGQWQSRYATGLSSAAISLYEPTFYAKTPVGDVTGLPDGTALLTYPGGVLWVRGE